VAPGGSSKSQWMLQLGVSVATGIDLAGHWRVGEVGGVLVLCAEDDEDEIHRRIHKIKDYLTFIGRRNELAPLPDRLFVFSTIGTDTLLTRREMSGEVVRTINVDRIALMAADIPDLKLIVIDPISRFRGGEENSNEDATRFVEALERLAQMTGATVMAAHHASKASTKESEANQSASRGASALTDGLRWQMNLTPPNDRQAKEMGLLPSELKQYVVATVTKTNYSAPPLPVLLRREDGGYLMAVSGSQARNSAEVESVVRVMRIVINQAGPVTARWLEDQHGGVTKATKVSKGRLREVIRLAFERGWMAGGGRKPLTVTPDGEGILKCMPPVANDQAQDVVLRDLPEGRQVRSRRAKGRLDATR